MTWFKNGVELSDQTLVPEGAGHVDLLLKNVNMENSGKYSCQVNKSKDASSFKIKVKVLFYT